MVDDFRCSLFVQCVLVFFRLIETFLATRSKRKGTGIDFITDDIGRMQPMMKYGGYLIIRQKNRKHNASSDDWSAQLKRSHRNSSQVSFSAKPWLCACECTSMNNRSWMLYFEKNSTNMFVSGWTFLWTKNENATWTVYRTFRTKNTESEVKWACKRDWKSGPIFEFFTIMIFDQIKALTYSDSPASLLNRIREYNIW